MKLMNSSLCVAAALALSVAAQAAPVEEPTTFLGLRIGAPLEQSTVPECPPVGIRPTVLCRTQMNDTRHILRNVLPELEVSSAVVDLVDGRVEAVTLEFPSSRRTDALVLLRDRYGEPTGVQQLPYKNTALVMHNWHWRNVSVGLAGNASGAGPDTLSMVTAKWLELDAQNRRAKAASKL